MQREGIEQTVVRIATAGNVDDGKSTLIGRLLHDSKNVYEDHIDALRRGAEKSGTSFADALALLTDGLRAEREQGITIDVAYRYFRSANRHFILADTPGHEQYTRNMATGCSTAHAAILLIDAERGVRTQTRRHAFIAALLGVPRLLIAVNKMDLVGYSEDRFDEIREDFLAFAAKLGIREIRFIPVSALQGDNVVTPGDGMPWYRGETVLSYLDTVFVAGDRNLVDFRFPVQYVIRTSDFRGYAGIVSSGTARTGEEVVVLPSGRRSRIAALYGASLAGVPVESVFAPQSVVVRLEDEIDISRGDMIVRTNNMPRVHRRAEAMVVWMAQDRLRLNRPYIMLQASRETRVFVDDIRYRVDVNTFARTSASELQLNEIGRVCLHATRPILVDSYQQNRATGNFVLVDPENYMTVAAGMFIERLPEDRMPSVPPVENESVALIHREESLVRRTEREDRAGRKAVTIWLTGLSGSGKSSIAKRLERRLFDLGYAVYRLDGDNLRHGLNKDLGFSQSDRAENIRRAAEIASLFNDAGVTVICSFISPYRSDREKAAEVVGLGNFMEIHLSTSLEVCENRDPHGLYKKARNKEIPEFTGITSPYEAPEKPALVLDTAETELEDCVERVLELLAG